MRTDKIFKKLSGGDLRSEGKANEVALEVVSNPSLLADLSQGLLSDDKVLRGRTCMAMEIISREQPELLTNVVQQLIELAAADTVPQVRWHIAEILGNVDLSDDNVERTIPIILTYLKDKSELVKYCSVQTLGGIGRKSPLREKIISNLIGLKNVSKSLGKVVAKALHDLDAKQ